MKPIEDNKKTKFSECHEAEGNKFYNKRENFSNTHIIQRYSKDAKKGTCSIFHTLM